MLTFSPRQPTKSGRFTMHDVIERDIKNIWHPCAQMKDYINFPPLPIVSAEGSYITLQDGRKIIDAIASWWCKSLGHQHPRLKKAIQQQIEKFEHVIFANTTYENIVLLSEKLTALTKTLKKIFYAGDGSSAIEIALKMSIHARKITGESKRTQFIALENSYHGETLGALSVSDLQLYAEPYRDLLFTTTFLSPLPYVTSRHDPLWQNCANHWEVIEKMLAPYAETATALIVEPILQGAGGMQIYSQDLLKRLRKWTKEHNIHLIADEIMTGIGRTGKMLACEHADIEPDICCLAKGLTAGWLPFSAVLMRDNLYQLFYDDYDKGKSFLHSHTYSGNALGASLALEVLNIMQEEQLCERAIYLESILHRLMQNIADETKKLSNVRSIGAMVAADLIESDKHPRLGFQIYQKAVKLGALLRPLGNTIYWLPPLNIDESTLDELQKITRRVVSA